jgi:hypothetical protein
MYNQVRYNVPVLYIVYNFQVDIHREGDPVSCIRYGTIVQSFGKRCFLLVLVPYCRIRIHPSVLFKYRPWINAKQQAAETGETVKHAFNGIFQKFWVGQHQFKNCADSNYLFTVVRDVTSTSSVLGSRFTSKVVYVSSTCTVYAVVHQCTCAPSLKTCTHIYLLVFCSFFVFVPTIHNSVAKLKIAFQQTKFVLVVVLFVSTNSSPFSLSQGLVLLFNSAAVALIRGLALIERTSN